MNIINKTLLNFALLPASLYRKTGVNTNHLRIILSTKLLMDDRRPNTFQQTQRRRSDKPIAGATLGTMILCAFMGFAFLFSFQISNDVLTQFTIYFTLFFVILVSTLVADFTSVLIDVRDNYIIFPKPVSDKTFVLSRLLHILIHVSKIIIPISLPAVIYLAIFKDYLTPIVFFLVVIMASAFSIFLINIIYLLILKITSPKKFQVIISYVQILMTILIFSGYQIMISQVDKLVLGNFSIKQDLWLWLLPSYWFALGLTFFAGIAFKTNLVIGALLTILVPPVSLWTVLKYFAPSFNQKLSLITNTSEESGSPAKALNHQPSTRLPFPDRLAKMVAKTGVEQMGFLLTWKLTGRLRDFKLKVYPSIGYLLVIVAVGIYRDSGLDLNRLNSGGGDSRMLVMSMVYLSSFLLLGALGQLQFSEKFKAGWFYFTMPVKKPGLIFSGALKAVTLKFYIPVVAVLSILLISIRGFDIVPNVILGISNVFLGSTLLSLIVFRSFPFSAPQQTAQKLGAMLRSMLSLGLVSLLGLLQFVVFNIPVVVIISIVLSALANWLLLDYIKNKSWGQVLATYNE